MRLATWNSCLKFARNLPHLLDLDVDVAVVCEAQPLGTWPTTADGRTVVGLTRPVGYEVKHLAVLAREPWTVRPHPDTATAPPWTLPVVVDGPRSFTLVGAWTVQMSGWPDYVPQIAQALEWVVERGGEDVVVAGDLNAPIASSQKAYDVVVEQYTGMGLVDAYRGARGLGLGDAPPEPTYFHHWKRDRPFHIDHVLLPTTWAQGAVVQVGDYETWVASKRSDHVPVVVDLA